MRLRSKRQLTIFGVCLLLGAGLVVASVGVPEDFSCGGMEIGEPEEETTASIAAPIDSTGDESWDCGGRTSCDTAKDCANDEAGHSCCDNGCGEKRCGPCDPPPADCVPVSCDDILAQQGVTAGACCGTAFDGCGKGLSATAKSPGFIAIPAGATCEKNVAYSAGQPIAAGAPGTDSVPSTPGDSSRSPAPNARTAAPAAAGTTIASGAAANAANAAPTSFTPPADEAALAAALAPPVPGQIWCSYRCDDSENKPSAYFKTFVASEEECLKICAGTVASSCDNLSEPTECIARPRP